MERKDWGQQRSPQCIYTNKQRVARTELAAQQEMSTIHRESRKGMVVSGGFSPVSVRGGVVTPSGINTTSDVYFMSQ